MKWIKLHRQFAEWGWYQNSHMVHLFVHLLISAKTEDSVWQDICVHCGQLTTTINTLSNQTGIATNTVRRCLKKLAECKSISVTTTNKYTLITICNYSTYQGVEANKEQTNEQTNKQTNRQASEQTNGQLYLNNKTKDLRYISPLYPPTGKKQKKPEKYFDDEKMNEAITQWLAYKKEKRQTYKPRGLEMLKKKLLGLSGGNGDMAMQIVEQSMMSNYSGLFALKQQAYRSFREQQMEECFGQFNSDPSETKKNLEKIDYAIQKQLQDYSNGK